MQSFEILLNNRFTSTTQSISSTLQLQGDYYVYVTTNGGGIVNQFNVRGYLNDSRNQQIITDFFAYLTGSTSQDQALNIVSSDQKLASVFNDYYQRVVLSATQIASTAVINQNLTGTTEMVAYNYNHLWNGFAPPKQLTGITQEIHNSSNGLQSKTILSEFTDEESYYIPVYIERGTNQLARYAYDICDVVINSKTLGLYPQYSAITNNYVFPPPITSGTRIHTLLNCFVDINLETDENSGL